MAVDWLAIRNDYINGGGSYRKLAEKYGIPFSVLKDKAVKEKWAEAKADNTNKVRTKTEQKSQEKISDALSDEAALKTKLRTSLLQMAADWVDSHKKIINTGDFRRIVQSCIDLGIAEAQEGGQIEDDGLLAALGANAQAVFGDGDDSGILPEEKDA